MSRFESGWVKFYREDIGLIGQRYEVLGLWTTLLCMASRFEIQVWMNSKLVTFPAGSIITSLQQLAQSNQQKALSKVRRDLKLLEALGRIQQYTAKEGRVISITHWETEIVENSDKMPENSLKNRQINSKPVIDQQQGNDSPDHVSSGENNSGKIVKIFGSADVQQASNIDVVQKRQSIGEGEENKNKKEELKGEKLPAAPVSPVNSGFVNLTQTEVQSEDFADSAENRGQGQQGEEESTSSEKNLKPEDFSLAQSPETLPVSAQTETKAPKLKRSKADPMHTRQFIASYVTAYQQRYGTECRPVIDGKTIGQMNQLLASVPVDQACNLIQVYCQMEDDWFLKKAHDFTTFTNNLNKVSNALNTGNDPNDLNQFSIGRILKERGLGE